MELTTIIMGILASRSPQEMVVLTQCCCCLLVGGGGWWYCWYCCLPLALPVGLNGWCWVEKVGWGRKGQWWAETVWVGSNWVVVGRNGWFGVEKVGLGLKRVVVNRNGWCWVEKGGGEPKRLVLGWNGWWWVETVGVGSNYKKCGVAFATPVFVQLLESRKNQNS